MTWFQIKRLGFMAASFAALSLLLVLLAPGEGHTPKTERYANGLFTGP